MLKLSIISPVYQNENIELFVKEVSEKIILKFQKQNLGEVEFIIAEDGSKDNTRKILLFIKEKYNLKLNLADYKRGYLGAKKDLFKQASGEFIFFSDSDGEHNQDDFWNVWNKITSENLDMVIGWKKNRKPFFRVIFSIINNLIVALLFKIWLHDSNCGFRILKKDLAKKIIPKLGNMSFAYNTESVIYAHHNNYRLGQVPVSHNYIKSTVLPLKKIPKILFNSFLDLFKLKFKIRKLVF